MSVFDDLLRHLPVERTRFQAQQLLDAPPVHRTPHLVHVLHQVLRLLVQDPQVAHHH